MAAIFQVKRGDSSNTSSLVNGELYLNNTENAFQVGTNSNPIKLLSLNTASFGDIILTGSAYISGNVVLGGTITIGDNAADSVIFNADLSSSIIPDSGSTYDLGSSTKFYRKIYGDSITGSFTGSLYGMGDPTTFSASVDNRLDRVEASASLYDNAMSGSNRLYVSPSGSDSNDGSDPSVPFRTIKAAVEYLGSAVFSNVKRYTIFVGSGEYTEQNPIALPPGVAIVGDTLRTVRLTAANPTKDYFHCHDGNYFYGLRFLNLQNPAFAFSYPCSSATASISAGGVSSIGIVHSMTGYTNGNNQDLGIIIEGPDVSGSIATATANVVGGVITQINVVSGGTNYVNGEKPHISIPAPLSKRPIIGTSPYIQNCSSITGPFTTDGTLLSLVPGTANYAPLPYNINDVRNESNVVIGSGVIDEQGAGGGIRIDGNLVHPSSPLESFVADAFTQVNQGGPGHLVINKGYAQFVSCFTTFCTYGFKVANGGFANISNSVIDFGAKGLVSKTYFPQTYNTGSSLQTLTSTVVGAVIDQDGAGYTGSVATVTISGGGGSGATAEATVNANGSINEIVILTPGSGYTSQPTLTIAAPTGGSAIQAYTVASKANISGIAAILFQLESGSRGVDVSSNMILNGTDYLVTNVATGSSANQRYVTVYPAPPSITTGNNVYFHQLSNISTGGLVMEYVGSGVTYNALPKYGGVPNRNREIVEYAPGRVFYSTVDNIGNLKIGDFFAVNQLTGEVTIDANQFNLSGLSAIGPFKRNGVGVGVILNEVSNNTTLLNAQGITGEDTVPTQFAVKGYVDIRDAKLNKLEQSTGSLNTFSGSTLTRLGLIETSTGSLNGFSGSTLTRLGLIETSTGSLNSYTASLKDAISVSGLDAASTTTIKGDLIVNGTTTAVNSTTIQLGDNIIELNGTGIANGGLLVKDPTAPNTTSGSLLWDSTNDYWKGGAAGNESKLLLAGGDGVLSGSTDFSAFSTSVDSRLDNLEASTASLNQFSSSTLTRLGLLETSTGSLNNATQSLYTSASLMTASISSLTSSVVVLQSFSGNVNTRFDNLATYTGSMNNYTGSVNDDLTKLHESTASLNSFTQSTNIRLGLLETSTGSLNQFSSSTLSRLTLLETSTGSLNSATASLYISTSLMTASIVSLNQFSSSATMSIVELYWTASNHEGRIDYIELQAFGGVDLQSVSASLAVVNSVSGSWITESETGSFEKVASATHTLVSGSSQVISLLPTGVISGSSQILGGSTIHSGSSGDYQFNSIGVGAAASTTTGEIRAIGDITAYYSSDIRLKENIVPIVNALTKVNQISGNTYDWKEGYEEIHSHKGNDVGVIAQEIEEILPQIVTNRDNGYKAVQYEKIIPLLIEAIKELSVKIKELENK